MAAIEIDTPSGLAKAHLNPARTPRAALILGHGAGGGVGAKDLQAAQEAALATHVSVALVEQPYRVAGRRSPAPAHHLDAAWMAVVERLGQDALAGLPLITGGRSSGARVACRTAGPAGAVAVLCLAFPFAPRRRGSAKPPVARLDELEQVSVPVLVVQGDRDQFGIPPESAGRKVALVSGDHSLRSAGEQVAEIVGSWLSGLFEPALSGHGA
jgi:uncharacterized protein